MGHKIRPSILAQGSAERQHGRVGLGNQRTVPVYWTSEMLEERAKFHKAQLDEQRKQWALALAR